MATVTGYTATRMKAIEDSAIIGGTISAGDLLLDRFDGGQINAGQVQGPQGEVGPAGPGPDWGGYVEPINDRGNVSGVVTLDFDVYHIWRINPTGVVNIAFSGLPGVGYSAPGTLIVMNDSHAITWTAGTKFPEDLPPEILGETWISMVAQSTHITAGLAWKGVA